MSAMSVILERMPVRAQKHAKRVCTKRSQHVISKAVLQLHAETARNLLYVLKRAKRNGAKLTMDQLCELLGVKSDRYRTTLRILNALCISGMAHRDGKHRHAVYWADTTKGST